jgi:hypothetical protein
MNQAPVQVFKKKESTILDSILRLWTSTSNEKPEIGNAVFGKRNESAFKLQYRRIHLGVPQSVEGGLVEVLQQFHLLAGGDVVQDGIDGLLRVVPVKQEQMGCRSGNIL